MGRSWAACPAGTGASEHSARHRVAGVEEAVLVLHLPFGLDRRDLVEARACLPGKFSGLAAQRHGKNADVEFRKVALAVGNQNAVRFLRPVASYIIRLVRDGAM